jgi:hypothetical protein
MTRLTDNSENRKEHGNGETVKMGTKENKGKGRDGEGGIDMDNVVTEAEVIELRNY